MFRECRFLVGASSLSPNFSSASRSLPNSMLWRLATDELLADLGSLRGKAYISSETSISSHVLVPMGS